MFNKQLYFSLLNSGNVHDIQYENCLMGGGSVQLPYCTDVDYESPYQKNGPVARQSEFDEESSVLPMDLVKTEIVDDDDPNDRREHAPPSCALYDPIKVEETKLVDYGREPTLRPDVPGWHDRSFAVEPPIDPKSASADFQAYGTADPDVFERAASFGDRTKADVQRSRRANETLERRLIRLEKDAQRKRLRRLTETDEQRAVRRARCAQRNRERRMCETDDERARRRERDAVRARQRRSGSFDKTKPFPPSANDRVEALERKLLSFESEPARIAWLEAYALDRKRRRSVETPDERIARRDRDAKRARERRMRESEAERAARRVADACRARVRRALESEDERRRRLARNAERKRAIRRAKSTAACFDDVIAAGCKLENLSC